MVVALAVGVGAGLVTAHRWSLLVAPAAFTLVFELTRVGVDGPTVDGLGFGFYGMVALVLGRGLHGLLVLAPMVVGAVYGVWISARLGSGAIPFGKTAWTFTGLTTAALLVLAVFVARPATTAPIPGPDGEPLPGSVAELVTVTIGGHDQAMMIRGRSIDNPVLLYLTGGPGGTDLGALRRNTDLEEDFVVVAWEQRGAGKSYAALDPTDTFTLDRLVADTIEVTDYLKDRFGENKIYLVGQSWGSTLGVLAAQENPESYHAFVGVGQMVSQRRTDILFWQDTISWAEATGNDGLVETLRRNGPPPYEVLDHYEPVVNNETVGTPTPNWTWPTRCRPFSSSRSTPSWTGPTPSGASSTRTGPSIPSSNRYFGEDVPRLEVPTYMVLGNREARGRAVLAEEWFAGLEAPAKGRVLFDGAGNRAHFDQPGRFAEFMADIREEVG